MPARCATAVALAAGMLTWGVPAQAARPAAHQTPEQRAVDYLAREVPRWSKENHCFSCHNNGDGARALYAAAQRGYKVPAESLRDTSRWLLEPANWDTNRGNPAFSDKKLARLQFAASLAQACDSGLIRGRQALLDAAQSLVPWQEADGSWQIDTGVAVGSPVTWGATLATYMARRTLEKADGTRFADAIARANTWFRRTTPQSILDAAATLLALSSEARSSEALTSIGPPGVEPAKAQCLDLILRAQNSDGGWGPRLHAPSEPFDTAVVLLALREVNDSGRTSNPITRGRGYLIAVQQPSGGWPETTRPPGAQSYAQHISTSGWATLALVLTNPER